MNINYLLIHHTAVSRAKNPDQFEATNEYHRKKWNSKSQLGYYVGYHYEIASNGTVRQARSETESGIHVVGHNYDSIGTCLDGNFDIELPTPEQTKSLTDLLLKLKSKYPEAKIDYHRNFAPKSCPGKLIADNWASSLISNKKDMPILTKDNAGNQYVTFEEARFAWSIPDQEDLPAVKKHFKFTGEAILKDLTGYFIIHGNTAFNMRTYFNL